MRGRNIYSFSALAIFAFLTWQVMTSDEQKGDFPELVKISLREAGNQLLLSNKDTTSLILPVVAQSSSKFELSFQRSLSFEPNMLVSAVKESFQKAGLAEHYIVEVIQCTDKEVAYSYKMTTSEQTTIIPCSGRYLPQNCYTIQVSFIDANLGFNRQLLLYIPGFLALVFLGFLWGRKKRNEISIPIEEKPAAQTPAYTAVGCFQFYPEQNKLVAASVEIGLSRKECELLAIFVEHPNQIIKRDELTKKVWEDNGVIVGRSLDTYISKLRKKLQADDSIKLSNVHGVGYKLELNG